MKVLTIANLKGGVGKTVTTVNVAYLLAAEHGKKVLVVDNDQQGNVSNFFGVYDKDAPSMSDVLKGTAGAEIIRHTKFEGLDVVPANLSLAEAEKALLLDSMVPQQLRLQEFLDKVKGGYDYVLIDNSPSIGVCVINSLVASNYLIIPAKADGFSMEGVEKFIAQSKAVKKYLNGGLALLGIVLTDYRRRDPSCIRCREELLADNEDELFDTFIRHTDRVNESTMQHNPIVIQSPRCGAARDYRALTQEVLNRIDMVEYGE